MCSNFWKIESRSKCKASIYIMFTRYSFNKKRIKDLWQFASIKLVHKREFNA